MDITFVGTKADTSPACVSIIGRAVKDPVLPLTFPPVKSLTYSSLTLAALSNSLECK